jgi:hypothetical protein
MALFEIDGEIGSWPLVGQGVLHVCFLRHQIGKLAKLESPTTATKGLGEAEG